METFLITDEFTTMLIRLILCLAVNTFIIFNLYYKKSQRKDFSFTFVVMTVAIFFLVFFMMGMDRGKATMGVGLGLFGIFSIMRYRTDSMPVREMTYLFVIICLAVVHAMAGSLEESTLTSVSMVGTVNSYLQLGLIDVFVVAVIWAGEKLLKPEASKLVQYDRIDLVKPERHSELMADLEERLGLKVRKVEVGGVDMLRDMTVLRVYYEPENPAPNSVDNMVKVPKMK